MDIEFVDNFDESSWYVVTTEDVPGMYDAVGGCDFSEILTLSVVTESEF